MLRRHRLISEAEQAKLADFISHFEYTVMLLLAGGPADAFADWPLGAQPDTARAEIARALAGSLLRPYEILRRWLVGL